MLAHLSLLRDGSSPGRLWRGLCELVAWCLLLSGAAFGQGLQWRANGPSPNTRGQVENIAEGEVVGAINAVAPHPTDANVLYVGAVNGGIWKTNNAMAANPTWQNQTGGQKSLSIGALEFDPTDTTHNTLVAGFGRFSSFLRIGGPLIGILRTTNGGGDWTAIDGGGRIKQLNISGVAPRNETIVISVNDAQPAARVGIWRSTNLGANWRRVSGSPASGLPEGAAFDLIGIPGDSKCLFTNAGAMGIYRSKDAGATWDKVSNAAMDALLTNAGNVEMAAGKADSVYVAIVVRGSLADVFRSADNGNTWTALGEPLKNHGGIHPGGQGDIHLSIAADPTDASIVYLGGDRQEVRYPIPNFIGARDYTGLLVRGDASQAANRRWVHITHSKTIGPQGAAPQIAARHMRIRATWILPPTAV